MQSQHVAPASPPSLHPSIHPPPRFTPPFTRFFPVLAPHLPDRECFTFSNCIIFCPYNKNDVYWRLESVCVFIWVDILPGVHWGYFSNPIHLGWFTFSTLSNSSSLSQYSELTLLYKYLPTLRGSREGVELQENNFLGVLKVKHQENCKIICTNDNWNMSNPFEQDRRENFNSVWYLSDFLDNFYFRLRFVFLESTAQTCLFQWTQSVFVAFLYLQIINTSE